MKKFVAFLLTIVFIMSMCSSVLAKTYSVKVTYSATLISNDHVGSNWSKYVKANSKKAPVTLTKLVSKDKIKIYCKATENDSSPDIGTYTATIKTSDLKKGTTKKTYYVTVVENKGRYSGHKAKWKFVVTFKK